MSRHRETNPHFDPSQPPVSHSHQPHHVATPHAPPPRRGRGQTQPLQPQLSPTGGHFPLNQQPYQSHYPVHPTFPQHQTQPQHVPETHFPTSQTPLQHPTQPVQPQHPTQQPVQQQHPTHQQAGVQPPPRRHRSHGPHLTSSSPILPRPHKTRAYTWLLGTFCALFWIAVILGGIVVLIVYLLFRPRGPKFDVSSASLNAAYLDMGHLLNADMTLLTNFTNPSKKATVDFSYMFVNLYFQNTLIATSYVEPFSALKAESKFRSVHLVSSQVSLSSGESQLLQQEIENNRVRFDVKGVLKTRSNLGSLFRYSYRLYGHCIIEVTGPPSGVLVAKKCTTKR